jgi:hypothetical protein
VTAPATHPHRSRPVFKSTQAEKGGTLLHMPPPTYPQTTYERPIQTPDRLMKWLRAEVEKRRAVR